MKYKLALQSCFLCVAGEVVAVKAKLGVQSLNVVNRDVNAAVNILMLTKAPQGLCIANTYVFELIIVGRRTE
ncbi:hypothetical protein ACKKBG_A07005 [Auxenochlorella protothecoides x Auxenochlorella symbiontica]